MTDAYVALQTTYFFYMFLLEIIEESLLYKSVDDFLLENGTSIVYKEGKSLRLLQGIKMVVMKKCLKGLVKTGYTYVTILRTDLASETYKGSNPKKDNI